MAGSNFSERFGSEYEPQVSIGDEPGAVAYANGGAAPGAGNFDASQQSSLTQLAEQTVIEAHKLAETIKDQGVKDGQAEAVRIASMAEARAKEQTAMLLESARDEAASNADAVMAQAEKEALQMVRKARREAHDIVMAAKQQADDFAADAKLEAEYKVRKLTAKVTDEIRAAVANISNNVLPEIDEPFEDEIDAPKATKPSRGRSASKR